MGQALNIALLPGDGIGPEVMDVAEAVLDLLIQRYQLPLGHTRFDWPSHAWHQSHGQMMPSDGVAQLREFDAMLLGALGDPGPLEDSSRFVLSDSVSLAPLLALRKQLDLWACERPARWLPGAPQYLADPRAREVDMLVFTARATERLIRHAFRRARQRSTQREVPRQFKNDKHAQVCLITKRNAQPFWGDLYTDTFHRIAAEFPDVHIHHELVDAACMKFVQCPWRFDVVVASNLHGDILTDLAAVLCGGPGLAPSANLNPDEPSLPALFEPVHGSAPDIAGQNLADPRATLMSLAMLLDNLAHHHPAIGSAAQHLHDLIQADLAREANGEAFSGTRETGQRLCQWLAA